MDILIQHLLLDMENLFTLILIAIYSFCLFVLRVHGKVQSFTDKIKFVCILFNVCCNPKYDYDFHISFHTS